MGVLMDIRATRSHRGTGAIQGEARTDGPVRAL